MGRYETLMSELQSAAEQYSHEYADARNAHPNTLEFHMAIDAARDRRDNLFEEAITRYDCSLGGD